MILNAEETVVGGNMPSREHVLQSFLQSFPEILERVQLKDDIASRLKYPTRIVVSVVKSMLSAN